MLSDVASNSPRYRTSPCRPSSAIATAFRTLAASIPTYASLEPAIAVLLSGGASLPGAWPRPRSPARPARADMRSLAVEDGRPGLCRMAAAAAHAPRQQGGRIRPDPIRAKPVVPAPHGLPGAELLRQKAPLAAGLLQVQTGVHHLPQIDRQARVASEQRREQRPFRVRQITGVTPPVILVSLTLRIAHAAPQPTSLGLPKKAKRTTRPAVKQALRNSQAKWFIRHVLRYEGGFSWTGDAPCEARRFACAT